MGYVQAKNIKALVITAAMIGAVVVVGLWALSNKLGASKFGRSTVVLENGAQVYVVRESWGLHSEELSITQNPDGCLPPNPTTDYIDKFGDGHSLVYSIEGNQLILFSDEGPLSIEPPQRQWLDVHVTIKKTRTWSEMLQNPGPYNVSVVTVPLNEACWKNFFRKAGTSLRNGR